MSTSYFSKRRIASYLAATRGRFSHLILIVADSLEARNYEYFRGLPTDRAAMRSKDVGAVYLRGYRKLSQQYPSLVPIASSVLEATPEFVQIAEGVNRAFTEDWAFRTAIRRDVVRNIGNMLQHPFDETELSPTVERYVLAEAALTLQLVSMAKGHALTQLSPKPVSVLADLDKFALVTHHTAVDLSKYRYEYLVAEAYDRDAA